MNWEERKKMKGKKEIVITCPKCGYEYVPAEILYPDEFVGDAVDVVRSDEGKVQFYDGNNMNLFEEFTCDHCGTTFGIKAKVSFLTKVLTEHDFSEDYKTKIKKKKETK